jgi:hypothetical protein
VPAHVPGVTALPLFEPAITTLALPQYCPAAGSGEGNASQPAIAGRPTVLQ